MMAVVSATHFPNGPTFPRSLTSALSSMGACGVRATARRRRLQHALSRGCSGSSRTNNRLNSHARIRVEIRKRSSGSSRPNRTRCANRSNFPPEIRWHLRLAGPTSLSVARVNSCPRPNEKPVGLSLRRAFRVAHFRAFN